MRTVLLLILCLNLSVNVWAQQLAPDRTFEEMLAALPAADVKQASRIGGKKEEKRAVAKALNQILQRNEVGKKWTLKFVKGKKTNVISPSNLGKFENDFKFGIVRVNDIKYYVSVEVSVLGPVLMAKADKLREGQRIFVSGTLRSLSLFPDMSMVGSGAEAIQRPHMQVLMLRVEADDVGLQSQ